MLGPQTSKELGEGHFSVPNHKGREREKEREREMDPGAPFLGVITGTIDTFPMVTSFPTF